MLAVLGQLQRLWYLILFCSTVCLISDITLSSISDPGISAFIFLPLPLIADLPTVLIFAYGIWGKSRPFLLPSSTSNPCMRWIRLSGTVLLCLLWILNTFIYSSSGMLVRRILAGVSALTSILILVEMFGSHRVGKEQRKILKKEKRIQQEKMELKQLKQQKKKDELQQGDSGFGSQLAESSASRQDIDFDSDHDEDEDDEDRLKAVEIIRPEAIDPSTVIHTQQLMYEMHQREYFLQYQSYLQSQQSLLGPQPNNVIPGPSDSVRPIDGTTVDEDGKYDDILLESSYKIEIPIDGALENLPSNVIVPEKPRSLSISPATPPATMDVKTAYMHLPSAPSMAVLDGTMAVADSRNLSSLLVDTASTSSSQSTLSSSSSTSEKPSTLERQVLQSSSPYLEQDYQSKSQEFASAPPYESRPSFQAPALTLMPAPTLTLLSTTAGSVASRTAADTQSTADSDQVEDGEHQTAVRMIRGAKRSSI